MNTTLRRYLLLAVAALLAAGCQDLAETPTTLSPSASDRSNGRLTPGATFDWTMPERFGLDEDGDGLTDYLRTAEEISPSSWPVHFDACEIEGGARYVWHVDRRPVASVESCRYTHEFPAEGTYDVAVHVLFSPGRSVWAEEVVTVQDWLIVSFGDSYASGEGVPEVPAAHNALIIEIETNLLALQDARAHRDAAREHFLTVFEAKGLWEARLEDRRQRRQDFLNACTIDDWDAIAECATFIANLPFDTYDNGLAHFNQLVSNAQERVNSLANALAEAQAALDAAITAVVNLEVVIRNLGNVVSEPRWQAPYANEDWANEDCHRSANAAPARAALELERSDPRTSVTFVHFACSGAQMIGSVAEMTKQVPWANALIGPREIDAVLLSIGGNDAGFVDIATACGVQQPCYAETFTLLPPPEASVFCDLMGLIGFGTQCDALFAPRPVPFPSAAAILSEGVNETLPGRYEQLAIEMFPGLTGLLEPEAGPGSGGRGQPSTSDPLDRLRSDRVYITEYVDMTKDDELAYCAYDRTDPLGTLSVRLGITPDELEWLDRTATAAVNGAVERAADLHGWNYVSRIYSAYASHGYCAEDHWVVRLHETFLTQLDEKGIAHPNNLGHILNGQAILVELAPDLYPGGLEGAPRAPDVPTVPIL